jgi:hypothetical protein
MPMEKMPVEYTSEQKAERRQIRKDIGEEIFKISQLTHKDFGISEIKLGEVQNAQFVDAVKRLLADESLWQSLPEETENKFTLHGQTYGGVWKRDEVKAKIEELLQTLEG